MRMKCIGFLALALPTLASAQVMRSFDLVTPPGAPTFGVAHIEDVKVGDRRRIHAIVTTNDGSGELTFDGRTIRTSDGYAVVRETLANTPGALVVSLTASAPDGTSESAILVAKRPTGEVSAVGLERYSLLLQGSTDVRIINQVLPAVLEPQSGLHAGAASIGRHAFRPGPLVTDSCFTAALALASATLAVEVSCVGGNPACPLAVSGWLLAVNNYATNCPSGTYDDGTIGWG